MKTHILNLKCEHLLDPLGLSENKPRFSWELNLYTVHINGRKVGKDRLNPGQLSKRKGRALYRTYDVLPHLKEGRNALGFVYGAGRISAYLRVDYEDEEKVIVDTYCPGWKFAGEGPFTQLWYKSAEAAYEYGGKGEVYDAREEYSGWAEVGFDDSKWTPLGNMSPTSGNMPRFVFPPEILKAQMQSVEAFQTFNPVSIKKLDNGETVVDFGQDFNGYESIRIRGSRGTQVTMRFAERPNSDGSANFDSVKGRAGEFSVHEDIYIKKGDGPEDYAPDFAHHGFRFIQIRGLANDLKSEDIKAHAVCSAVLNRSSFSCSDSSAQRLHEMCLWSMRSNLVSVPTDCDNRERNGWLSSGGLSAISTCANFDMRLFYEKWFDDIADSQNADGQLPGVAPFEELVPIGVEMLQCASVVFVPVETYMAYGDISSLRTSYETLLKFANFVRGLPLVDGLSSGHMSWNDWFAEPSNADRVLLENLSVCLLFRNLAWIANELGETEEVRRLTMDAGVRSDAINKKFFRDGNYGGINTQTEISLALAAGVVPQAEEKAVAKMLFDDIEKHGSLSVGIYGVWALMTDVLPRFGRNDLAWKMVKGDKSRTFGFWLVDPNEPQGLTSIPERWITDRTHPGNQTSHMDFTSFDAWFHRELAGLKPTKPGYKEFLFAPFFPEGVESAATTKETPYGLVSVSWKRKGNELLVKLDVPVSVEGVLRIPGAGEEQRVGSGKHEFRMILAGDEGRQTVRLNR